MARDSESSGRPLRVLIVDDHRLFSDGLVHLLREPGFVVVGTARTIEDAAVAAAHHEPDVVLVDYLLPDGDGTQAIAALQGAAPDARLVVVTALNDDATLAGALDAGCDGFVTKDRAADDLIGVLRAVARGETGIGLDQLTRALPRLRQRSGETEVLTRRELQVVALLAEGLANAEIGDRLSISTNTVRNHVGSVLAKLGARSRLEAVAVATRRGLVSSGSGPR